MFLYPTTTWIAIYIPLFILLFVILPQKSEMQKIIMIIKRRKRLTKMTNEVIRKYIGEYCKVSSGQYGITVKGKIINVNDNWIEISTRKGNELVNAEFVQSIKIYI
jgi:hypothetical protein